MSERASRVRISHPPPSVGERWYVGNGIAIFPDWPKSEAIGLPVAIPHGTNLAPSAQKKIYIIESPIYVRGLQCIGFSANLQLLDSRA